MEEINKIIDKLIEIKENCDERIEEEIYGNMNYNYDNTYKDLTESEIKEINKYRKNIFYIYEAIHLLDKIKNK